jgi:hypothetical protein
MSKLLFLLTFGLFSSTGRSQSIFDLTAQLALDVQKLSSLKATLQDMYQGYDRLKTGFTGIRDIARDNFNLHKDFLDALWVVSPAVRSDPRGVGIVNTASVILAQCKIATAWFIGEPRFTAQEMSAIGGALAAMVDRCNEALKELSMVTTDNELRMSDAQRLAALDRIHAEVKSISGLLRQFNTTLAIEVARRQREAGDIHSLKLLYGLPD